MSRVVLIGPMGSGKTKVGRRVARALGLAFVDTDKRVVEEHGEITGIFESFGEEHFRSLERAAVSAALRENGVISLGGGAILHPDTQADLRHERVVLLTVRAEVVAARIKTSKRPLLSGPNGGAEAWKRIYEERREIYEELADVTFDTSTGRISDIARMVAEWARSDIDSDGETA
ncbi:shikimate kinase [Okibacterium endophyticum]